MEEAEMFVVVAFGEYYASSHNREGALLTARDLVDQHLRGRLPLQVTEEIARNFDVRVYALNKGSQLTLPFQEWVDANHKHAQEYAQYSEEREYQQFVELRAKFEDRYQQENPARLPNCS